MKPQDRGKDKSDPNPAFLIGPRPVTALSLIHKKWGPVRIVYEARELTLELARAINPRDVSIVIVNDPSFLYRKNSKEVIEILDKGVRVLVVEADRKAYPKGYITIVYELGFIPLGSGLKKVVGITDVAYSIYQRIGDIGVEG